MADAPASTVVRLIRQMADGGKATDLSDCELLERFRTERDEDAFQALVRRHGAMVLRVCRNVLGHEQDAEDAFQSTFLVLARRCGSIRKQESLAGWLHGVAHRTALHAKRTAGRRRIRERQAKPTQPPDPAGELSWREVQAILDEEIQPAARAAADAVCPVHPRGTARHGCRSRTQVEGRYCLESSGGSPQPAPEAADAARAVAAHGVGECGRVGRFGIGAGPCLAVTATVETACVAAGGVSERIEALARGVGNAMFGSKITTKVKAAIACLAVAGAVALGTSLLTLGEAGAQQSGTEAKEQPKPAPAKDGKDKQPASWRSRKRKTR